MRRIGLIMAMVCGLALGVPQQASTPTLSEVDQLLLALSDITWFHNIRPLNLTKTQIERLIPLHERAYKQLVSEVATELKPTFTDEQFQYMVKRSKEVLEAARVDVAQLKDDQLYALFVESVFLDPRAPELLKEWQRKNLQ